ncbi:MAG: sugar ABC transporter permease [Defluviitaleaceae bacterium]|nr:sugar ABC transporter permease [Defluviitaleaceae bacterium]
MKRLEMKIFPYLMLLPMMIIFTMFLFWPALNGFWISLHNWDGLNEMTFVGIDNYTRLINDRNFVRAFQGTMLFTAITVPSIYVVSLALALMLTRKIRLSGLFRAIFYWPTMISSIIVGLSWRFLLGESFGLVNYVLVTFLGMEPVRWMTNTNMAMFTVIFVTTWSLAGYYMVMLIAGIKSISETYYEAAEIDGASFWQQFFHITLPLLRPMSLLVLVLSTVTVVRSFPLILALTGGGPAGHTRFMVQQIHETGFSRLQMGSASAMAVVLFVVLAILTAVQFRLNRGGGQDAT